MGEINEEDRFSDYLAETHIARDAEREPARLPRYPLPKHRRLELQARFATLLSGTAKPEGES